MKHGRLFLSVAAVALLLRLAHLWSIHDEPFYRMAEQWASSDMHQYLEWGRHLAAGDWLDRQTFRPWFEWQEPIAPPEIWNSWFGAHVYYQPPLYPYLLALVLAVTGSIDVFRVAQVLLGALNCGMIALLGARLFRLPAGWIAGMGAAVYAPFIVLDAELLRGTVVAACQLLLLLALAGMLREKGGPPGFHRLLAAGGAFGLAYLADPAILLFAPFAVAWIVVISWSRGVWWRPPILFAFGAMVALSPLLARNLAVDAPLLSSTTRGPLGFVMGNAPDARPAGAFIPVSTGDILHDSGYRMGATIGETLDRYHGHYGALAGKQWEKVGALWGAYEIPDNPNFYYAARVSPVAAYGLRFLPVAALGLVGLALTCRALVRDAGLALVVMFLVSSNTLFLLAHVVGRYRRPMMIPLFLLAAAALVWIARQLQGAGSPGKWRAAAATGAAVLVAVILPHAPPEGYSYLRPAEFVVAAHMYTDQGKTDEAVNELRDAVEAARAEPAYEHQVAPLLIQLGRTQANAGRLQQAVESFQEALREDPASAEAAQELEAAQRAQGAGGNVP